MSMDEQQKAMDKVRDEAAKAAGDAGIGALGEWLTERLAGEPGIAPKILQKDKTLTGAFGKIRDYARKIAKGGAACVTDTKAFEIAGEYFGIPAKPQEAPKPQALAPAGGDALDLDALLNMD